MLGGFSPWFIGRFVKSAGAAWRAPGRLGSVAAALGVLTTGAIPRTLVLGNVRSRLGLGGNLPGVERKLSSLPRAGNLAEQSVGAGGKLLLRGHNHPDPTAVSGNFGGLHASPDFANAKGHGGALSVPGRPGLGVLSTFIAKPGQVYYTRGGVSGGGRGNVKPDRVHNETDVTGVPPEGRYIVDDAGDAVRFPFGRANDRFMLQLRRQMRDS